jgi:micrococcal nuclease
VSLRILSTTAALAVAVALAWCGAASASVKRLSFTSVVPPNGNASLTVSVKPRARCTIRVVYDTVVSEAKGLGAKTGSTITWRWKVGSSTHPGRWPVTVNCGKSGTLSLRLRVAG